MAETDGGRMFSCSASFNLCSSSLFQASSCAFAFARASSDGIIMAFLEAVVNPSAPDPVEIFGIWKTGIISSDAGLNQSSNFGSSGGSSGEGERL